MEIFGIIAVITLVAVGLAVRSSKRRDAHSYGPSNPLPPPPPRPTTHSCGTSCRCSTHKSDKVIPITSNATKVEPRYSYIPPRPVVPSSVLQREVQHYPHEDDRSGNLLAGVAGVAVGAAAMAAASHMLSSSDDESGSSNFLTERGGSFGGGGSSESYDAPETSYTDSSSYSSNNDSSSSSSSSSYDSGSSSSDD